MELSLKPRVVGVDLRLFSRGSRTGIEEYVFHLLEHLVKLDPRLFFKFFSNSMRGGSISLPCKDYENVETKTFSLPNKLLDSTFKVTNCIRVDRLLDGCDVFFSPHFLLTPLSRHVRRVLTFHDLSFERFPEFFSWEKNVWHTFMNPKQQAQDADHLIAVSHSTKEDLVNIYNIDPAKITVIHSGITSPPVSEDDQDAKAMVKRTYHLPDVFILYFGTIEPRKNVIGLLQAFTLFKDRNPAFHEVKLVIAGRRGWLYKDVLKEARRTKYADEIIFTDFVEEAHKLHLYRLARLFVYPSFFEGFGFPPLEAMAAGTPVITSNTSSFPEVVGEAGLMVDPSNIDEIAWAIETMLRDEDLRNHYIEKGFAHVKRFSWERCAEETLHVLLQ